MGDVEDFSVGTKITTSSLQTLRGLRRGPKTYYKTASPSKQKDSFL